MSPRQVASLAEDLGKIVYAILTDLAQPPGKESDVADALSQEGLEQMLSRASKPGELIAKTIERICTSCQHQDPRDQVRVAAFIGALYAQHAIEPKMQVEASVLKRFGAEWFPSLRPQEGSVALDTHQELENFFYQELAQRMAEKYYVLTRRFSLVP